MKNVLKITVFSAFLVFGGILAVPSQAHAIDFNPMNPIDPFCLFSCPKPQPTNVYNTVGSYNTNSFNNNSGSLNGSLNNVSASGSDGRATYYQTSPIAPGTSYQTSNPVPVPSSSSNYNYNYNYNTGGGSTYVPPVRYYDNYYYTQPVTPAPRVIYTQPNYYYQPTPVYYQQTPTYYYQPQPTVYAQPISYAPGLQIACAADVTSTRTGVPVTWSAEATYDGIGSGFAYSWSGTEGLYGYQSSAIMTYYSTGTKSAIVTVTAPNGVTQSKVCSNTVTVKNASSGKVAQVSKPKPTVTPTPTLVEHVSAASLFSLGNVPWGWVAVLIILVLLGFILYMIFNKKKI